MTTPTVCDRSTATVCDNDRPTVCDTEPVVPRDPIDEAITGTVPNRVRDCGRCLFRLARRLKWVVPDASEAELREIVAKWVLLSEKYGVSGLTSDYAWKTFVEKSGVTIEKPFGAQWDAVVERSRTVIVPDGLRVSDPKVTEDLRSIAKVLIALHELEADADGVFFVGLRQIEDATGINYKMVSRRLPIIGGLGFLERVKLGDHKPGWDRKASRYRWFNPSLPYDAWHGTIPY